MTTHSGDERVVDSHNIDGGVLHRRTQGEAADAAEAVDANVEGHGSAVGGGSGSVARDVARGRLKNSAVESDERAANTGSAMVGWGAAAP